MESEVYSLYGNPKPFSLFGVKYARYEGLENNEGLYFGLATN